MNGKMNKCRRANTFYYYEWVYKYLERCMVKAHFEMSAKLCFRWLRLERDEKVFVSWQASFLFRQFELAFD